MIKKEACLAILALQLVQTKSLDELQRQYSYAIGYWRGYAMAAGIDTDGEVYHSGINMIQEWYEYECKKRNR